MCSSRWGTSTSRAFWVASQTMTKEIIMQAGSKIIRKYKKFRYLRPPVADRGYFLWDYRGCLPGTFEKFRA
jgi:hypothetical protein